MANPIEQLVIDELAEDLRILRKLIFEIPFMSKGSLEACLSKPNNAFQYLYRDGELLYIDLTMSHDRIRMGKSIIEAERRYGK